MFISYFLLFISLLLYFSLNSISAVDDCKLPAIQEPVVTTTTMQSTTQEPVMTTDGYTTDAHDTTTEVYSSSSPTDSTESGSTTTSSSLPPVTTTTTQFTTQEPVVTTDGYTTDAPDTTTEEYLSSSPTNSTESGSLTSSSSIPPVTFSTTLPTTREEVSTTKSPTESYTTVPDVSTVDSLSTIYTDSTLDALQSESSDITTDTISTLAYSSTDQFTLSSYFSDATNEYITNESTKKEMLSTTADYTSTETIVTSSIDTTSNDYTTDDFKEAEITETQVTVTVPTATYMTTTPLASGEHTDPDVATDFITASTFYSTSELEITTVETLPTTHSYPEIIFTTTEVSTIGYEPSTVLINSTANDNTPTKPVHNPTTDRDINPSTEVNIDTTTKHFSTTNYLTTEAITTTTETLEQICPPGTFENIPHPELCNSFYMCSGGFPVQLFCSDGFEFDPISKECVLISDNGCTALKDRSTTKTYEIPTQVVTEDYESTSKVETTTDAMQTITTESNLSSTETTEIDWTSTEQTTFTTETTTDFSQTPTTVGDELTTNDAQTTETIYSTNFPTTEVYDQTVTEENNVPTVPPPICPDGYFGNIPHPELCDSFYMCAGGFAIQLFCSSGFEYDHEVGHCVLITDSGCTASKGSTTTTAEESSTEKQTSTTYTSETSTEYVKTTPSELTTDDYFETSTSQFLSTETGDSTSQSIVETTLTTLPPVTSTQESTSATNAGTSDYTSTIKDIETTATINATYSTTPNDETSTQYTDTTAEDQFDTTLKDLLTTSEAISTTNGEGITTDFLSTTPEPVTIVTKPDLDIQGICPIGVYGNIPHPDRCDSFFLCTGGLAIQFYCSYGFEFDPELGHCVTISENGCTAMKGQYTTEAYSSTDLPNTASTLNSPESTKSTITTDVTSNEPSIKTTISIETTLGMQTEGIYQSTEDETTYTTIPTTSIHWTDTTPETVSITNGMTETVTSTGSPHTTEDHPNTSETQPDVETEVYPHTSTEGLEITTKGQPSTVTQPWETSTENVETTISGTITSSLKTTTNADLPSTTQKISICPDGYFGNVPHPELCDSFYMCVGGFPIQLFCSDGFEYSETLQVCVPISEDGCMSLQAGSTTEASSTHYSETESTLNENQTTSPSTATGGSLSTSTSSVDSTEQTDTESTWMTTRPEITSKTTTYQDSTPDTEHTTSGFTATADDAQTNQSSTTVVYSTMDVTTEKSTTSDTPTSTTQDVGSSVSLDIGQTVTNTFPTSEQITEESLFTTVTDPVKETTEAKVTSEYETTDNPQITTEEMVATTEAAICPPGVFGNLPHPDKCDSFYMCAGGIAIQLYCSNGFEFDVTLGYCVMISENGCTALKESSTTQSFNPSVTTTRFSDTTSENFESTPDTTKTEGIVTLSTIGIQTTYRPEVKPEFTTIEGSPTSTATRTTQDPSTTEAFSTTSEDKHSNITIIDPIKTTKVDEETSTNSLIDPVVTESNTGATSDIVITTESFNTVVTEVEKEATVTETKTTYNPLESSTVDVVTTEAPICPPGVFGNLPNSENCDSFYMCAGGVAIPLHCSNGFEFDPELGHCVLISETGCTALRGISTTEINGDTNEAAVSTTSGQYTADTNFTPSQLTTSSDSETKQTEGIPIQTAGALETTLGNHVSDSNAPTDSSEYTKSVATQTINIDSSTKLYTTSDLVSDKDNAVTEADVEYTTQSVLTTTELPICPPGMFGNVPHPTLCSSFYMCAGGIAIPLYCSNGFEYDVNVGQCVPISENGCTAQSERTTSNVDTTTENKEITTIAYQTTEEPFTVNENLIQTTEAALCPPGSFGSIPHPTLCDSFYMCTGNVGVQLFCSSGFEFDPALARCVLISDNGCTAMKK